MQSWVDDLKHSWKIIAISVGGTFLLGIIYMFMIRIFSGVIVWGSIILYFAALLVLGVFLYNKLKLMEKKTHIHGIIKKLI